MVFVQKDRRTKDKQHKGRRIVSLFFLQLNYRTKIYYTMTIILITLLAIALYLFIKMTNKYQETHDKYMGSLDKLDRLRSKTGYYEDVYNTKDS